MTEQIDYLNEPDSTPQTSQLQSSLTPSPLASTTPQGATQSIPDSSSQGDTDFQIDADLRAARDELRSRFLGLVNVASSFGVQPTSFDTLLQLNVLGTSLGVKETQGQVSSERAVRVYVEQKVPESLLGANKIPAEINGIPTDVVEVGDVRAFLNCNRSVFEFRARQTRRSENPNGGVRGGASIGRDGIGFGTFGCLCIREGKLMILSNNHVLANTNGGRRGDLITQPGGNHGGVAPRDGIAVLQHSLGINMSLTAANQVDGALAWTDFRFVDWRHHCYTMSTAPLAAAPRQQVMKEGARTGFTSGKIVGVEAELPISYPRNQRAMFVNQIEIRGNSGFFSDAGDSGSIIVEESSNRPIGLLFAGNAAQNQTFANPISTVMSSLHIERLVNQFE